MKRAVLAAAVILAFASNASADYGWAPYRDTPVKQGMTCNFSGFVSWWTTDTPIRQVTVLCVDPDGFGFTPSYTYTINNTTRQASWDGAFSPSKIGTYKIMVTTKDEFGTTVYWNFYEMQCISRY